MAPAHDSPLRLAASALAAATAALLAACGQPGPGASGLSDQPVLGAARPGSLARCEALAREALPPGMKLTHASEQSAGPVMVGSLRYAEPAHCLVQGEVDERIGTVDGKRYAIGFEMRLPRDWNGRFFYQANGGLDGVVVPAVGGVGGGAPVSSALAMGFAVISSDAGHPASANPAFGLDPQARLDYGYRAVQRLTPLAKWLVTQAYGRPADRSYIGGCSNGGRHAMVAAARLPGEYDGVLAGDPGYRLPRAAVAQLFGAQQFAPLATARNAQGQPDLSSAFLPGQLQTVSQRVLARCDAQDGLADGIVGDGAACQKTFDLARDVPTCEGTPSASCLSAPQKQALAAVMAGPQDRAGQPIYSRFGWDSGIGAANWREWKFISPPTRDAAAVKFIFSTPPLTDRPNGLDFALGFDLQTDTSRIFQSEGRYGESAMQFMSPPERDALEPLRRRGARMIVYHGLSDPVFSADDTQAWYERLQAAQQGRAAAFARYFPVPGMNHCSGGPSVDQFDLLTPLVAWVEQGRAPDAVVAQARGVTSAVPNPELPPGWASDRSRPLCAWPAVARYKGGDTERATSFECRTPAGTP